MSNDPEKTIRPEAPEPEKTMRPEAPEKTMRPEAEADKTMRPGQEQEKESIINRHFTEFVLDKVTYTVAATISDGTGEAQIFLVENGGKRYALKLYHYNIYPPPDHDIMETIRRSAGTGLLVDTFAHGRWTDPRSGEERDYELMEYCEGGSLDRLRLDRDETRLGEIALRAAAALDFLHRQHIIHRDVKPANFFFRKPGWNVDDMALADFGIAVASGPDGKAEIEYQLRTKIYIAPEYYDIADGKIQISTKSDFFSLGMTLMTLLDGEEIFKINEFELNNMKKYGRLPYPQDVSERTLQLIKALTLPDPNARAGFEEVKRWAQGENIYDLRSSNDSDRKFRIIYNPAKKQTAESPEDLARFMLEDRELAGKYLYSGKIDKWLTDNLRPDLAIDIETFVERTYPKDQTAGLLASCYRLDEEMPYTDVTGRELHSPEEIARSLRDNFDKYAKSLGNRNDSLYLFFNARGLANVTNEFSPKFKKSADNRDALLQLIHTLDQTLPWLVVSYDGKVTTECRRPEEVIRAWWDHGGMSDLSWADLLGEGFLTWLRYVDPAIEGKVRSASGSRERQSAVLYNLSPKVGYNYQLDESADNYFFTAAEVGNYMNIRMEEYIEDEKNSFATAQLAQMLDIEGTRLWDYFKSKGVYDDKIEWIKYCSDLERKQWGPLNWQIAVFKAIKGLGYNPTFYFPGCKKRIRTLEELSTIPSKELKAAIKSPYLRAWLTTFYQEDPAKDRKDFEKETVKYIEHLERLDPTLDDVVNFNTGRNAVRRDLANVRKRRFFHLAAKIWVGAFLFPGTAAALFMLLTNDLPINVYEHGLWIQIAAGVIGVLVTLVMFGTGLGCLINLIVGGLSYAATFALFRFLTPYIEYILAAALLALLIRFFVVCYFRYKMHGAQHRKLFRPTFEEMELEPLQFTYSDDQSFTSSIGETSQKYATYLRKGTRKIYKNMIFPTILLLGAGYLIWWGTDMQLPWGGEGRPAAATETTAIVTADVLNVRKYAEPSAEVIGVLRQGEEIRVVSEPLDGWIQVEFGDGRGWVSDQYIRITQ